jgi:hypothetical protein
MYPSPLLFSTPSFLHNHKVPATITLPQPPFEIDSYTTATPPHPNAIILPIRVHLLSLAALHPRLPPFLLHLQNIVLRVTLAGLEVDVRADRSEGEGCEEEFAVTAVRMGALVGWERRGRSL